MNIKNWHGCCSSLRQYQFVARYPHGGGSDPDDRRCFLKDCGMCELAQG